MSQAPTSPAATEGRLARRKARTRAAILNAASTLFSERGFEATAMHEIAQRADTGVGTLYGYFRSKEEVLEEVLKEHSALAVERYREAVDDETPPLDRLCAAISAFTAYLGEHRTLLRATFNSTARDLDRNDQPPDWVVQAFSQLIASGMASGDVRSVPVETAARSLVSTCVDAMLGMGVWRGHEDDPGVSDNLIVLARACLSPGG